MKNLLEYRKSSELNPRLSNPCLKKIEGLKFTIFSLFFRKYFSLQKINGKCVKLLALYVSDNKINVF